MRIKFTAYRAADCGWRVRRNRYYVGTCCEQTIGVGFLAGRRAFGVTWRSPRTPSVQHDRTMHATPFHAIGRVLISRELLKQAGAMPIEFTGRVNIIPTGDPDMFDVQCVRSEPAA